MFVRVAQLAAVGAASLLIAPSLAAQQAPTIVPSTGTDAGKMNQRHCETIVMTGSRLAKKKFCATRAEWEDKKLQDRKVVEQFQTMQCMYNRNDPQGRPTC